MYGWWKTGIDLVTERNVSFDAKYPGIPIKWGGTTPFCRLLELSSPDRYRTILAKAVLHDYLSMSIHADLSVSTMLFYDC
jgi:hypothetical protein